MQQDFGPEIHHTGNLLSRGLSSQSVIHAGMEGLLATMKLIYLDCKILSEPSFLIIIKTYADVALLPFLFFLSCSPHPSCAHLRPLYAAAGSEPLGYLSC